MLLWGALVANVSFVCRAGATRIKQQRISFYDLNVFLAAVERNAHAAF
jgi:hypothetical protein